MKFMVEVRKTEPYAEYRGEKPRREWATLEIWPTLLAMGDGFASCVPYQDYQTSAPKWIGSTSDFSLVMVDIPIRRAQDAAWLIAQNLSELTGTNWDDEIDNVVDQLWTGFPMLIATSESHTHSWHLHRLIEWVCRSQDPLVHEDKLAAAIDFVYPGRDFREELHAALTDPQTEAKEPEHRERYRSSGVYHAFVHARQAA